MIEEVAISLLIFVSLFIAKLVNLYGRSAFEAGEYGEKSMNTET